MTQLQVMQSSYQEECGQSNTNTMFIFDQKKGITWGTKLCKKFIEATHLLWTKRNSFKHDRQIHDIQEVEDIRLKTALRNQYIL